MLKNLTLNLKPIDLAILINIFLIAISLIIFSKTNIDVAFQNLFFDFENKKWLVDKEEPIGKFFFYNLPKILLGLVIAASLIILLFKKKFHLNDEQRKKLFIFLLGITIIPLTCGNIKKFTNIYCPGQLEIYDGSNPYVKILDSYPADFHQTKKGKCFPAGHAVTGFCLMILFFIFEKKSWKIAGLLFGLTTGWIFGFYQIAKGAHFLSDTALAMLCCFLVAMIIVRFTKNRATTSSAKQVA